MSIGSQPRFRLATLPTPLHELPRLRGALGGQDRCPRILIKRDDLTGLAFGGNKARKLEFLVGDALRSGATLLITSGAVQSNHARMTAAAARAAGLKAALVLTSDTERPAIQGNLLLDHILGAKIHFIPANPNPLIAIGDEEAAKIAEVEHDLRAPWRTTLHHPGGRLQCDRGSWICCRDLGDCRSVMEHGRESDGAVFCERIARHTGRVDTGRKDVRRAV